MLFFSTFHCFLRFFLNNNYIYKCMYSWGRGRRELNSFENCSKKVNNSYFLYKMRIKKVKFHTRPSGMYFSVFKTNHITWNNTYHEVLEWNFIIFFQARCPILNSTCRKSIFSIRSHEIKFTTTLPSPQKKKSYEHVMAI